MGRVCREAGARVRWNVLLRNTNARGVSSSDARQIEVVAEGLPLFAGAQLVIDTTLVSPLTTDGAPRCGSDAHDGAVLLAARRRKHSKYAVLLRSRRCHFLVGAMETGGRWCSELADAVRHMAKHKAESAPAMLRRGAALAWERRWTAMLAIAAQSPFAASLVEEDMLVHCEGSEEPTLGQLFADRGA